MSGYRLSPQAAQDVDAIWEYIADSDLDQADRVRDQLQQAMDLLSEQPGMGHVNPFIKDPSILTWRVFSYIILYRAAPDHMQVVRVVSGYRDLAALFGPNDRLD